MKLHEKIIIKEALRGEAAEAGQREAEAGKQYHVKIAITIVSGL